MATDYRCPRCNQPVTEVGKFWVCPEHGLVQPPAAPVTAAAPTERPKLFISYGRRDARRLADRLADDLNANGFAVWQDTHEIPAGTPFLQEIADGLRSAQVVVALMSPHSVRTAGSRDNPDNIDSVSLSEISYALFNPPPRPVVPVMALTCEPPLAIFHLDYVDLRAWSDSDDQYQAGFRRLLAGIQAALRGERRYRRWHHQLDPFDFAAFLHGKRRDFTGRQWLFDRIDAWRTEREREPALLIVGDPGTGKSAIVAELVHRNPGGQVLAYHCCQWDVADTLKASRFVRSIAAMIAGKLEGYAALMEAPTVQEALSQSQCESDPGSALEKGVLSKLEHVYAPEGGPRYLLIDALDESLLVPPGTQTIVALLASRLDRLPAWLRIVATTRKETPVLDRFAGRRAETLDARLPENMADVRRFLDAGLSRPNLAAQLVASGLTAPVVAKSLCARSEGNFLYAEQALRGLEAGVYQLTHLAALPPGLGGLYTLRFERQFPNEAAFHDAQRLLDVVVAAREPLTEEQLGKATALDFQTTLPAVLDQLSSYVPAQVGADGQRRYAIYHKSLGDWLTDRSRRVKSHTASLRRGDERLAAMGWAEYRCGTQTMSAYALRHLPAHLLAAERWDDVQLLLTDDGFLNARYKQGLVCELVADLAAVAAVNQPLKAISEALLKFSCGQHSERLRQQIHGALSQSFGRFTEWPAELRKCLEDSKNLDVMHFLGLTLDSEREFAQAERVFKDRRDLIPRSEAEAYANAVVDVAYVQEHQDQVEGGLATLDQLISQPDIAAPGTTWYYRIQYHRGIFRRRLLRHKQAFAALDEVHQHANSGGMRIGGLHQLGVLDLQLGRLAEAEAKFQSCRSRRGDEAFDHRRAFEYRRLGQVYALLGRFEESQSYFQEAIKISTYCGEYRYVREIQDDRQAFLDIPQRLLREQSARLPVTEFLPPPSQDASRFRYTFRVLAHLQRGYLETLDPVTLRSTGDLVRWDLVHAQGLWHATVMVLVVDRSGNLCLQQRGEAESTGRWDVSVAGHRDFGESDVEAALRETGEELGLTLDAPQKPGTELVPTANTAQLEPFGEPLQFIKEGSPTEDQGQHVTPYHYRYRTGKNNCERASVFLAWISESDKREIVVGPGRDVLRVAWVSLDALVQAVGADPEQYASAVKQLLHPEIVEQLRQRIRIANDNYGRRRTTYVGNVP